MAYFDSPMPTNKNDWLTAYNSNGGWWGQPQPNFSDYGTARKYQDWQQGPEGQYWTNLTSLGRQNGWMNEGSNGGITGAIGKGVEYGTEGLVAAGIGAGLAGIAGVGPAAASSGGAATSAVPGTISGTGLGGSTGVGALTASTPTVGALTAGGTGTSIAAGGSGSLPAATTGASPWWTSSSALVPAAIGGSAVLGYLGSKDAAGQQADAAEAARRLSEQQNAQARTDLEPWRTSGAGANTSLSFLLGTGGNKNAAGYGSLLKPFTGADLQNEPGFQFGQQQGEQGINRAAAGRGSYDSGATLKALTRFNNDYGTTKYDNAFNRDSTNKSRTYGFLSGVSNTGVNAAGQTAGLGAAAARDQGGYISNAGDAGAAGSVGGANAITGGVNSYLNYLNSQDVLKYLRSGSFNSGGNAAYTR